MPLAVAMQELAALLFGSQNMFRYNSFDHVLNGPGEDFIDNVCIASMTNFLLNPICAEICLCRKLITFILITILNLCRIEMHYLRLRMVWLLIFLFIFPLILNTYKHVDFVGTHFSLF